MDTGERVELVARHTEEVVTEDELRELFAEREEPRAYIGYAPTGEMHIGHFTTMRKLADFLRAGLDVTVLIADLHAHLDDEKSPFDLLDARSRYYEEAIRGMIDAAGADAGSVGFVRGTEFELDQPYTLDLYRAIANTTISRAQRAGSEVVRASENPKLGGLVYTLMQSLDVAALEADIAYGGIDQRGIYMLARELLPEYLEYLVFPVLSSRGEPFVVERDEEWGGDLVYETYDALADDFVSGELHPADLKPAAADAISDVIEPVRDRLRDQPELLAEAYPETHGDD